MTEFVPLFQTLLWILFALILILIFRPEIKLLRDVLEQRLRKGSSVEIGPIKIGELRAELDFVREGLNEVNEKVASLFLTTMAPPMYVNLKKLASGEFGPYEVSKGLERELYHLRDIGYIEVASIRAIPKSGTNLSDHVKVTGTGRMFVELRESLEG